MEHDRFALFAGVAGSLSLFAGCANELEVSIADPVADEAHACGLSDEYEVLDTGHIVKDDIIVGSVEELEADCAAGRPWRGAGEARGISTSSAASRWPDARVPFVIDPALPEPQRVLDAMAAWEAVTPIRFAPKTAADVDYVSFTNSSGCSAHPGRQGGKQEVLLSTGKGAFQIVASSISGGDTVYTWYDDGMVTAGSSSDLDSSRVQYAYALPSGYTIGQIRGIGIAKSNDHVFTWYSDGRRSIGTSDDLDKYAAPAVFSLPPGKTVGQIVDIDISRNDRVYTWFSDGTMSIGNSTDLDAYAAPSAYAPASGKSIASIVGVGIAGSNDRIYAWYDDATVSAGNSGDFDASLAPYAFNTPGHCGVSQVTHEIGHVVGLKHEQSRCDRDSFVRVFGANIVSGKSSNFDKACSSSWQDIGAYNITSIMHYGSRYFSSNGSPTLLAKVPAGQSVAANTVVDMSIASTSRTYTWWSDGFVTGGATDDLESVLSRYRYELPAGYATGDIVGIGIAKSNDRVYTFYRDGRRSVGSTADLASISAPATYALPAGYTTADILAIDIASTDKVFTWYTNGRMSIGTSTDLDAYAAPANFSVASGRTVSSVLGIGIAPNDWVYAWYTTGQASAGNSTDLDSRRTLYSFMSRLGELFPSAVLNAGDIAAVDVLYPRSPIRTPHPIFDGEIVVSP